MMSSEDVRSSPLSGGVLTESGGFKLGTHKGSEAKRIRIKEEAGRLFLAQGFSDVTLKAIADAAGMGKASLYHYYPGGKEELFRTIVREAAGEYFSRLRREAVEEGQTTSEKLRLYLIKKIHHFWDGLPKTMRESERRGFIAQAAADTLDLHSVELGFLIALLEEGAAKKEFRAVHSPVIARVISAVTSALTVEHFYQGCDRPEEYQIRELVDFTLAGLESNAAHSV